MRYSSVYSPLNEIIVIFLNFQLSVRESHILPAWVMDTTLPKIHNLKKPLSAKYFTQWIDMKVSNSAIINFDERK